MSSPRRSGFKDDSVDIEVSDDELDVSVQSIPPGSSPSLKVSDDNGSSSPFDDFIKESSSEDESAVPKMLVDYSDSDEEHFEETQVLQETSMEGIETHGDGSFAVNASCAETVADSTALEDTLIPADFSFGSQGKTQLKDAFQPTPSDNLKSSSESEGDSDYDIVFSDNCSDEDSSSEPEDFKDIKDSEKPLYEGASISLNECLVLILLFSIRYSLNSKCLADLLRLIFFICKPLQCRMKSSCYHFWKYFSNLKSSVNYHYFCSECNETLPKANSRCPFAAKHQNKTDVSYFIEIPLVDQIKAFFQQESFVKSLTHRFHRVKTNPDNIEDIFDGQVYKEQVESGFLSSRNPYNFSLMLNTDGVPVYHSSGTSLWPVYFVINELPLNERFSRDKMLLGGLWYGKKKPSGNLMIGTFRETLINLFTGVAVTLHNSVKSIIVKGKLLFATCDLPAKCMIMGMTQFNGEFGCHVCKQKGESVKIEPPKRKNNAGKQQCEKRKASVYVYKFDKNIELRNHDETVNFGLVAQQQREANPDAKTRINVFGVLQPSALSKLMPDFIRGMAIDIMHCLFLGNVKKLAILWFSSKYSNEPFSVQKYMNGIDKKFLKICPPNFVQRNVRSIVDHMHHWKASEWRNFFFYYSIPLLDGVLPRIYLDNYYDLVISIYELHGASISPAQILSSSTRLSKFVEDFQNLYGERHMSMNIHLLLHIPLIVNNLGPLWAYSCAAFENLNGILLKIITGTRHVQTQLANCAQIVVRLPSQLESITSSDVRNFCYDLLHPSLQLKVLENISTNTFSVGTYKLNIGLSDKMKNAFRKAGFITNRSQSFFKLKKGRFLFVSESYSRQKRNVSSYVSCRHEGVKRYGSIISFHRVSGCKCNVLCLCKPAWFLALIKPKNVESVKMGSTFSADDSVFIRKLIHVDDEEHIFVVDINQLESMLYFVSIGNQNYVCDPVNMLEAEL